MRIVDYIRPFFSSFTRFFGANTPQSSTHRTRVGVLVAMILLPLLLGVLACLPVPVGDPEKSRIDPTLSGVWLPISDSEAPLMVFDPYDKRTWLVSWITIESKMPGQANGATRDADNSGPTIIDLVKGHNVVTELSLFKGWLTAMDDVNFLTLEPIGFEPGTDPEYWAVFRLQSDNSKQFKLIDLNTDLESFDDVETSAEAEEIIHSNLKNPDLYDKQTVFQRASPNELKVFKQLLEEFGLDDGT